MSRLVMDVLFLEEIAFELPAIEVARCSVALSQEEVLRSLLELVGIELIDYGSFTVQPVIPPWHRRLESWYLVSAYSKAFRERVERDAMAGR
jgi:hypothetical protein